MAGFSSGASGGNPFGNLGQGNNNENGGKTSQATTLFGNTATTSAAPASGTTGPSLFGSATGTSTASPFSSVSGSKNSGSATLFGGNSQKSEQGSLFGAKSTTSPGSIFAPTGSKSEDNTSKNDAGSNPFPTLGTPNKQTSLNQGDQSQGGGLFGQAGSSTPANKLFGSHNNASTTPAGPPPANASANIFGGNTGNGRPGGLFGSVGNASNSSSSLQPSSGGGLFSSRPASTAPNLFGGGTTTSSGSDFPSLGQSKEQSDQQSSTPGTKGEEGVPKTNVSSNAQESSLSKPTSLFPLFTSTPPTTQESSLDTASTTTAPAMSQNPFANIGASKDTATPSSQTFNMFGGAAQKSDAATTTLSAPSLFASSSEAQKGSATTALGVSDQPAATNTSTSAPPISGATAPVSNSIPSTFGGLGQQGTSTDKANAATPASQKPDLATSTLGLGTSTTGQAPNAQSRLKNKSMDDIITRWASDLTKYQKEFQSQAERVAQWDRQLVDNSNAISKLYSKTFQAERDTAEIQKQLTTVEGHQEELSQWLDRYEQEIDELMSRQINPAEGLQGPDQERQQTYETAQQVSERLGEMGQDLASMIEEINAASSAISKTNRTDDPLSQVVRVLNGHLSQLQLIDQGTAQLQAKVSAAQRENQRLGSRARSGLGYDAAEEFGRSYMGRI